MKIFYQTTATATGGRNGTTTLDDGSLSFDLAIPNSGKTGANPEQLFALGYAACFDSALNLTAKQMQLPLTKSRTSVQIGIGMVENGAYQLEANITVHISGLKQEEAQTLIEKTHLVCPYSNATRGNINVQLTVITE
ncbi:organic hydroperoxide resistance protein [Gallibacterium salpingitidis]|uniref:Organic hydroperoxide resistance protein n=1 Tax=Gallibacterium salpingitidis TaxID=505341 RepID=A0AB36E2J4_9PAST|nr:organic hydroperoxide resistance protein [Gallibacterium salpingitidis]OBX08675.1 organic hydroperoxide resistance protein [Gallibacterium salpingitidis]OBX10402.1 organic hydroperoxide resistance protein [Gallibacterium salpingitidis]WKS99319.1 organic hydroperoxide resistance protein [Gallibacterium salpingitidis]